ncbi:MAG TPA: thiamine-phosphate kinase [Chthoniobacterales bacterium]|nr:thiamine-phosphate kinase [Chthoniobacterales bacterium]
MNLRELGEERLLRRLLPRLPRNSAVLAGAGDDCAVVRFAGADKLLLLKTDCVVEGIHFARDTPAKAVGWKAMARPLSDFAAMGGLPQFALITLMAPSATTAFWTTELYRGLEKAARAFKVAIVGGETSRSPGLLAISISVTGAVEKDRWISRSGGKAGDDLFVTGRLGGSLRGKHLRFTPRIAEARWLSGHFRIHAMMDLSDGLGADLPRLASASKVSFELEEGVLPRTRGCSSQEAITDGEDYELLFALAASDRIALERAWKKKFAKLPLTRIGRFIPRSAARPPKLPRGYDHFQ